MKKAAPRPTVYVIYPPRRQLLTAGREQTWTSDAEALRKRERIYQPRAFASVWAYLARRFQ